MPPQILVPLHTDPDGRSAGIAAHVRAVARHPGNDVHGMVLKAAFPPVSARLGNRLITVDGMVHKVTARCHARSSNLIVTGRSGHDVSMEASAETLVSGSGRPMPLVPPVAAPSPSQPGNPLKPKGETPCK